jgi:polysaccharide export outer membrane protein
MKNNFLHLLIILILGGLVSSCVSSKKMIYFQNNGPLDSIENVSKYQIKIQPGDLLFINVSAMDVKATLPFNLYESGAVTTGNPKPLLYLVNVDGEITFPVLGNIKVAGLTIKEMRAMLTQKLREYLKNPIVNVRLKNFKITVLGEVKMPGTYPVVNERITILEAIGLAGDLNIQAKRSKITLVREQQGKRTLTTFDLTSKDIFNSPYFYLAQNDVIYVEPNKTKMNSSKVGPNSTVVLSAISTLVSLLAILKIIK